ncbi:MAG: hypothetical protein K0S10_1987 [Rubrobacteraceae bacterium]|nr:hypothetical protein [Rubrobacteraceae bacterium]
MIERFYQELWNRWNLTVADEIVSEDVRFRGSLGSTLEGREARLRRRSLPQFACVHRRAGCRPTPP